jgi:hypothetical protein
MRGSWNHRYGRWNKKCRVSQIMLFIETDKFSLMIQTRKCKRKRVEAWGR